MFVRFAQRVDYVDTNVISELVRVVPNTGVVEFLSTLHSAWLSVLSLHEITYGLRLLPKGKRRSGLEKKLQQLLSEYGDLVIPIDRSEADQAAVPSLLQLSIFYDRVRVE